VFAARRPAGLSTRSAAGGSSSAPLCVARLRDAVEVCRSWCCRMKTQLDSFEGVELYAVARFKVVFTP
jgi:hypothetical protein